jgi:ADP-heptose:LPS heptosyltransferase
MHLPSTHTRPTSRSSQDHQQKTIPITSYPNVNIPVPTVPIPLGDCPTSTLAASSSGGGAGVSRYVVARGCGDGMRGPCGCQAQLAQFAITSCPNCPDVSNVSMSQISYSPLALPPYNPSQKFPCPNCLNVPIHSLLTNLPVPIVSMSQISNHKFPCLNCPNVPNPSPTTNLPVPTSQISHPPRPYAFIKQLLRTIILLTVRLIGAPGARTAAQKSKEPLPAIPRILLIRPDHLGDLVLTTPVLHALKTHAPNAHIAMMVGPWSSEVIARHPDLDQTITFPFPGFQRAPQKPWTPYILLFTAAQQLKRDNYDLVINLRPDFWWGAALAYLARIPRRIGYAIKPNTPFLTKALPYPTAEHWTTSNLRLASAALASLGDPPLEEPYTPERYPLQFTPASEEHAWVTERLSKEGIDTQTPIIVIHPGTAAAVKLWRPEAWSRVTNALTSSLTQPTPVRIILTGSKSERPMIEEIAQHITSSVVLITDATLGQLAALLSRAQLVLGVDSGPLHLATSQGTPTVRIFGPTDPRLAGPWGSPNQHLIIASTQRCPSCPTIPCGRLDFRPEELPSHPCTRLVPEQQVLEAIEKLLNVTFKSPIE